ncbi:tyrosine lyase ThiH [Anseongella ginsenosidimutans]|uniref:Tyrosine lyase ThiH n=1 Tax=Anseongella ginsenosidimutans TaxID=496056 RepID=A0A4R3KNQ9_9SPHI|nr:2-iminoacetate synthase ThiH [Anseongella ginsenosidimutans]QEC53750.1 2-iminoacetate synthase ThiH [Anseongella ginsenosidimutans]TCS85994.1 tyrosine lyase ThiH [Anseongella ginsenosidimutans]
MSFQQLFNRYNWDQVSRDILSKSARDVRQALNAPRRNLEHFKALLSPAALPFLDDMASLSRQLTLKRFGKTIQLYAPLYVSNECQNICTYCGFSMDNRLERKTLNEKELLAEAAYIREMGYDSLLLVSGEANKTVGTDYFEKALQLVNPVFSQVSLEVQPLEEEDYRRLIGRKLHSVLVYQETYCRETYALCHPKGKKSNFDYRLETPDRLGREGIHKIGLGVLLGLDDWRADSFFTALHLGYLEKVYWKTRYSISFPRLRPCAGTANLSSGISDRELVQLICAYRLLDQEVELSLSTRENEHFRNNVIRLGINSISAGSKTNPGGYTVAPGSLEQFEIDDTRSPAQIARMLSAAGYQPLWKDWDQALQQQ